MYIFIRLFVIFSLLLFSQNAEALNIQSYTNLNLGTISKLAATGSFRLSSSSLMESINNVQVISQGTAGGVTYKRTTGAIYENNEVSLSATSVTLSNGYGGTVVVNTFVAAPKDINFGFYEGGEKTTRIGATVVLTEASKAGTYTGTITVSTVRDLVGSKTNQTLSITLVVETNISVIQTQELSFGKIVRSGTEGTIALSANGNYNITGGLVLMNNPVVGTFEITGQRSAPVYITVDSSSTLIGPGEPILVNNIHSNATSTILDSGTGRGSFSVGGTVSIGANQKRGSYSGTYTVTASY